MWKISADQIKEYKEFWCDEFLKWICGFANAQGGSIFIGIDDKGQVKGIADHKKLLEDIPNKVVSLLGIVVDVNARTKDSKSYLEIKVEPCEVPISYHGAYHYRSGSTKQELRGVGLQQFLLKKLGKSWDDIPVEGATDDINEDSIKDFIAHAIQTNRLLPEVKNEDTKTILQALHLLDEKGQLKAAAILLFGKDPLKFFPMLILS